MEKVVEQRENIEIITDYSLEWFELSQELTIIM